MDFKESKYYDKKFLGKQLHEDIEDGNKIFTTQEYFNINDVEKEYHVKDKYGDYKLTIKEDYYELDCQDYNIDLYLIFDKPVHITGKSCANVIAPEIIVKSSMSYFLLRCVANNLIIDNGISFNYEIFHSKINNVCFYNNRITLNKNEINNFFILNKELVFGLNSSFLDYHKIKLFGECKNLKEIRLKDKEFEKGTIHIE